MKKYLILLIAILTFSCSTVNAKEVNTYERNEENRYGINSSIELNDNRINRAKLIPFIDSNELIYDFSNLLTDDDFEQLQKKIQKVSKNKKFTIVVVTTDDIKGLSKEDYADDFYDYNNFKLDGVLLLIDMSDRYVYISTSGEGQLVIDDERIELILDEVAPKLTSGDYSYAIATFIDQIENYLNKGKAKTMSNCHIIDENGNYECDKKIPYYLVIIIPLIITTIVTIIGLLRYKKIHLATNADIYLNKAGILLGQKIDRFVSTNTIRHYISSNSSSSSGGSSSHSSSSGHSHGGGGRHF